LPIVDYPSKKDPLCQSVISIVRIMESKEEGGAGEVQNDATAADSSPKGSRKRPAASPPSSGTSSPLPRPLDVPKPITEEGERPQKKFYRQRAHCNPLSHNDAFVYPVRPDLMDWEKEHYPQLKFDKSASVQNKDKKKVLAPNVLDIGCGFGGLTMALATLLPDDVILGCEIRAKVTEFVRLRIVNARKEHPGMYRNCSALRTNTMKFLVNFFSKSSVDKIFCCFPDPHFKRKNHSRRIVSVRLLSEYAYVLNPGGLLYTITDVLELHEWHVAQCDSHPLFTRLDDDQVESDPCVAAMKAETEEGKKVSREGREKYYAVYERIPDERAAPVHAGNFF